MKAPEWEGEEEKRTLGAGMVHVARRVVVSSSVKRLCITLLQ